jgi:hypothetical protein
MPNTANDRYRYGMRSIEPYPVKAAAVIKAGDFCKLDASGNIEPCASGDTATLVSVDTITGGASDGDVSCRADSSTESVYEYPPDSGTLTLALQLKTCDVGGPQSIDPDASADDGILIRKVDTNTNTAFISLAGVYSGVA